MPWYLPNRVRYSLETTKQSCGNCVSTSGNGNWHRRLVRIFRGQIVLLSGFVFLHLCSLNALRRAIEQQR